MRNLFDDDDDDNIEGVASYLKYQALERERERQIRLTQVAGKFATTLALKPVTAHLVDEKPFGDTPAWSDSENIYFCAPNLGDVTDENVVISTKGLTLHEISHIMWTPRSGSNLAKYVQKNGLFNAFNALEDQRIEMAMITKFPTTKDWLVAMIAQHLLAHPNQVPVSFPLLHGRKYLPKDIRKVVKDSYKDQHNVQEIADLIDEYILMNMADTRNYLRAQEIILRYHELVSQLQPEIEWQSGGWNVIQDPNGHNHRGNGKLEYKSSSNKPMGTDEQSKIMDKVRDKVDNDKQDDEGQGASGARGSDAQKADADDGEGNGTSYGGASAVMDIFKDAIDQVKKRNAKDIAKAVAQYNGEVSLTGKGMTPLAQAQFYTDTPSSNAVMSVKSFARELELIKAEHDPNWHRKVEQGKLDAHRYVTGTELDECFDEWDLGREDATDIECVVVLDISSSMSRQAHRAFESMWTIKRALDKIGANTTVLTFGSKSYTLYDAKTKADNTMRKQQLDGSTEPQMALKYARSILAESDRAVKIMLTITDGEWYDRQPGENDNIIKELRHAGVITALAFVYNVPSWLDDDAKANYKFTEKINTHGCEVAMAISDSTQLFHIAKAMVNVGIKRNLSR